MFTQTPLTLIPVSAFSDNYIWVLHDGRRALAVDPGDAAPLQDFLARAGLQLDGVLCTHHHGDHAGGLAALRTAWPGLRVFGPAHPVLDALVTERVGEGDQVSLLGLVFDVIAVPAHTLDHVAFYAAPYLFCGDTLFACGCGRLFEGTPAQLHAALGKLAGLPADTLVCCAHEYTLSNQRFALTVEPDNATLQQRHARDEALRARGEPTLPVTLADERACNPFLRATVPAVATAAAHWAGQALADSVSVLGALRRWKDGFRA